MSEHRILRLKPALRLERRGQHGQNKTDKRDHRVNFFAQQAPIRFSVHTGRAATVLDWFSKNEHCLTPMSFPAPIIIYGKRTCFGDMPPFF
jgi:hypothetical protein